MLVPQYDLQESKIIGKKTCSFYVVVIVTLNVCHRLAYVRKSLFMPVLRMDWGVLQPEEKKQLCSHSTKIMYHHCYMIVIHLKLPKNKA